MQGCQPSQFSWKPPDFEALITIVRFGDANSRLHAYVAPANADAKLFRRPFVVTEPTSLPDVVLLLQHALISDA